MRWLVLILLAGGLCASIGWWFAGGKVWTDGSEVRVAAGDTPVREIIWTPPVPLEIATRNVTASTQSASQPASIEQASLSPDGNELYSVRSIAGHRHLYVSNRHGTGWQEPVALDRVNSEADDQSPRVTSDGRYLLLASNRSGGRGGFDLWAAARDADGQWGEPFNLGPAVNTASDETDPDPTPDGQHLIFSTDRKSASVDASERWRRRDRPSGSSDFDLWIAQVDENPPSSAAAGASTTRPALPADLQFRDAHEIAGINTAYVESASCMSPAGDFLYFASDRPAGYGGLDLYRSRATPDWQFQKPENLGPAVNTADNETNPALAVGGYRLYFASDRIRDEYGANSAPSLFSTDSREVFLQRQPHPLPRLGKSGWIMLASLLLAVPLVLLLRGWGDRHLTLLQRCLLLSVLLHVIVSFCMSFVSVTQQVRQYVKQETGIDIGLSLPRQMAVNQSIRTNDTSDAPRVAPAANLAQENAPVEAPPLPAGPKQVDVEHAPVAQDAVATAIEPAHLSLPASEIKSLVAQPQPLAPPVPQVDVKPTLPEAALPPVEAPIPGPSAVPQPLQASANVVAPSPPPLPAPAVNPTVQPPTVSSPPAPPAPAMKTAPLELPKPEVSPEVAASAAPQPEVAMIKPTQSLAPLPGADLKIKPPGPVDLTRAQNDSIAPPPLIPPAPAAAPAKPNESIAAALAPAIGPPDPGVGAGDVGGVPVRPDDHTLLQSVAGPQVQVASSTARRPPDSQPALADDGVPPSAAPSLAPATRPADIDAAAVASSRQFAIVALPSAGDHPTAPTAGADAALTPPTAMIAPGPTVAALPAPQPGAVDPTATVAGPQIALPPMHQGAPAVAPVAASDDAARPSGATASPSQRSALADAGQLSRSGERNLLPGLAASAPPEVDPHPRDSTGGQGHSSLARDPALAEAPGGAGPHRPDLLPDSVPLAQPQVAVGPLPGALGPSHFHAPSSPLTQRAPELRKPLVEKLGGNPESENAVDHSLAYLARQQEPDGRWTFVNDDSRPGRRGKSPHDMAYTGLAVLSFLARDHTPSKPGPYREVVANGIQFLLDGQDQDGDLRGAPDQRGGGSGRANMYDHAIATLALAEAAMMTQDERCAAAVNRAAQFIVNAQNQQNGGWRYIPGEFGDTSVFGWEIMALHSAELCGFQIPDVTRRRAQHFMEIVAGGRRKMLAAYQPGGLATPTMTAELVFCRMLLGQKLEEADVAEASDYLSQDPPNLQSPDLYYWYYASLCMMQMQSPSWKSWNAATRDGLVRLQHRGGFADGSWTTTSPRSERGGYIFTTAIATLTLEVYYRYAHLLENPPAGAADTDALPRPGDRDALPGYRHTSRPKLDAN